MGGRCDQHKPQDRNREASAKRGYSYRWQKARKVFLSAHPLCRLCMETGRVVSASVVDHIQPHRGDQELFWDVRNWQPLCKRCHDAKTGAGM